MAEDKIASDTIATIKNRQKLEGNKNLLYWYEKMFEEQFKPITDIGHKKILEVGSGTSPLTLFYQNVITSDVMQLDYLDYIFDAHNIETFDRIEDRSLDIITITNVLHHLKDPIGFIINASKKLKTGGKIIFTEPFFSFISKFIYVYLHPEPTDFEITEPKLDKVEGPLSSANIALPFLIFNKGWDGPLEKLYHYDKRHFTYFSSISYMLTGGISKSLRIPGLVYRCFFHIDLLASKLFPNVFASFFMVRLTKKSHE